MDIDAPAASTMNGIVSGDADATPVQNKSDSDSKTKGGRRMYKRKFDSMATYLFKINAKLDANQPDGPKIGFTRFAINALDDLTFAFAEVLCQQVVLLSEKADTPTISVLMVREAVNELIDDEEMRDDIFQTAISFHVGKHAKVIKAATELAASRAQSKMSNAGDPKAKDASKTPISKSKKAGLLLPVTRFQHMLRQYGNKRTRIQALAVTALVAVIEACVSDLINAARKFTLDDKRIRITSTHINQAILGATLKNGESDGVLRSIFVNLIGDRLGRIQMSTSRTLSRFAEVAPKTKSRKPKKANGEDGGAAAENGEDDEEVENDETNTNGYDDENDGGEFTEADLKEVEEEDDDDDEDENDEEENDEEEGYDEEDDAPPAKQAAKKHAVEKKQSAIPALNGKGKGSKTTPAPPALKAPPAKKGRPASKSADAEVTNKKKRARDEKEEEVEKPLTKTAPAAKKAAPVSQIADVE